MKWVLTIGGSRRGLEISWSKCFTVLLKNQMGINAEEAVLKISEVTAGQTAQGQISASTVENYSAERSRNETEVDKASGASIHTAVDVTTHTQLLRIPLYSLPPSTEDQACPS